MQMINRAINFFKEAYGELKKATWLSRKEVIQYTIVVFIVCAVVAAYVVAIDMGLGTVISRIINRG